MSKNLTSKAFTLGVCYYPEHWDESLWADDFRRMKEMGFSIVRVGEFAWSIFEPEEGRFEFALFDRALDLAHAHGLQVIMGTPTATPPAWLTHKHPEVLNANQDGLLYQHGMRAHHNYNSPVYLDYCARIVRTMAEHYRDHPAIVGWQIDNELNCEIDVYYSESDHRAFRVWLQEKYGTLAKLNEAWGTVFWNQTYSEWDQVHLTRRTTANSPNPHLALDEKRFVSASAIRYAKVQADILREIAPHHWVTTNGLFGNLDSHRLTDEMLDFFSYDSYPLFYSIFGDGAEEEPLKDRKWSLNLSVVRDISENFCVMEQQAGPGGWVNRLQLPSPLPGQIRLWTYQSILHGADMILYFRWRTATVGTELYWHGINDYHNQPNRRIREITEIGAELKRIGERLVGRTYKAEVAMLDDYDNEWDAKLDTFYGNLRGQSTSAWFKQLQRRHIPMNRVKFRDTTTLEDLTRYRVLIYPHPAILTESRAKLLEAYAAQGGTLIFGARTGYKDETGRCYMMPFPGYAAALCGIHVEEFTLIAGEAKPAIVRMTGQVERTFEAIGFNEVLSVRSQSATVEAVYDSAYYAGTPALTRNRYGAGEVWYYGAAFSIAAVGAILDLLQLESPVVSWCAVPKQVELGVRMASDGSELVYLLNYAEEAMEIQLEHPCMELLTNEELHGTASIPAFGVMILERR
ncbi:beta-galactosidase [Paenibacillus phyllosphaerae]|uniref:Beta-galactosidase n=1 Tax=Paenibacillus phyllosphaerae TaxID=274593 RepID=A0A7W5AYM1_9BACL|nr:beta-galactosidase [Paenibacillus phyllosphaerae]MBB3111142.1 beta-galactosidase [Paenibacillus phyllosphaerae]